EGRAGSHPAASGLGRYSGRAQQPHCGDQVADHPAAGTGGADRWAGCDREGAVGALTPRLFLRLARGLDVLEGFELDIVTLAFHPLVLADVDVLNDVAGFGVD